MKMLLIALALAASLPAHATEYRESGNAISICTPARPIYDAGMRRRPLAIVNEGARGSFINCGFRTQSNAFGSDSFGVKLKNYTNASISVSCTGIFGTEDDHAYEARTVAVPAGTSRLVAWDRDQNGRSGWTNAGLQCYLPPGVGMTELPQAFRN